MSTHELLELATLDAMGLLDPDEREAFERAFHAAAPALQAQIRREQLRISSLDSTLPPVEPPPGLRARVMAAVRDAISSMTVRRIGSGAIVPELRPVMGVNSLWRVGAVAAAAASIVLSLAVIQMRFDYARIQTGQVNNGVTDQILADFGVKFSQAMFDPSTRFVQFNASSDDAAGARPFSGRALLVLDPKVSVGELFLKDLPADGAEYEVVIVGDDGKAVTADITIRPNSTGIERHQLENVAMQNAKEIGIRLRGSSKFVLRSISI